MLMFTFGLTSPHLCFTPDISTQATSTSVNAFAFSWRRMHEPRRYAAWAFAARWEEHAEGLSVWACNLAWPTCDSCFDQFIIMPRIIIKRCEYIEILSYPARLVSHNGAILIHNSFIRFGTNADTELVSFHSTSSQIILWVRFYLDCSCRNVLAVVLI